MPESWPLVQHARILASGAWILLNLFLDACETGISQLKFCAWPYLRVSCLSARLHQVTSPLHAICNNYVRFVRALTHPAALLVYILNRTYLGSYIILSDGILMSKAL
jgi:hypothetical protein